MRQTMIEVPSVYTLAPEMPLVERWGEIAFERGGPFGPLLAIGLPALALIVLMPLMAVLMMSLHALGAAITGRFNSHNDAFKAQPTSREGEHDELLNGRPSGDEGILRERGA